MWNPARIRAYNQQNGIALRPWQRPALMAAISEPPRGVIRATMGSGKSHVIACLAAAWAGPVVIIVPSVRLVLQTFGDLAATGFGSLGQWWGGHKMAGRVTVVCVDSLPGLAPQRGQLTLVDECHRMRREMEPHLTGAVHTIGFSATPYRADGQGLRWWDREIYAHGPAEALAAGELVSPRLIMPEHDADLDDWCVARIQEVDGPGVVSARGIGDADEFAARLLSEGISAAPIHSLVPQSLQADLIDDLKAGRLKALVHVRLLVEGVNLPWLRWLCFRREQDSRVEFAQMAGRGLRAAPGKVDCAMIDPHQLFARHSLSGALEIMGATDDDGPKKRGSVDRIIDPLTGELVDWSQIDATERRRIKALEQSWSFVTRAAIEARTLEIMRPANEKRSESATDAQLLQLRRHVGFCRVVVQQGGMIDGIFGPAAQRARAIALAITRLHARAEQGGAIHRGPCGDALGLLLYVLRKPENLERLEIMP